jgi:hypothetical protein
MDVPREKVQLIHQRFPMLAPSGYKFTSPKDDNYNCIAWAAGDKSRRWWPDMLSFWPKRQKRESTLEAFEAAFGTMGYARCNDTILEPEYEKVAIYADLAGAPLHAALQLPSGRWTSKLGLEEDIEHELHGLSGDEYGYPVLFMRRKRRRAQAK